MEHLAPLIFEISINTLWPGEKLQQGDKRWREHTANFHKEMHTIDSLVERVTVDGCAFAPVMRGDYRSKANFISAQHIGLDDDRGTAASSLQALAEDPFITEHAALVYETPSSTPECPKSRIVFVLDQPFSNAEEYRIAQEAMWWKFGFTDQNVKEPARFFYGRPQASSIKLDNILYGDVLQEEVIEPYLAACGAGHLAHITTKSTAHVIPRGDRNSSLFSMAGTMRSRGFTVEAITKALAIENLAKCVPPLDSEEVEGIAKGVTRYPAELNTPKGNVPPALPSAGLRFLTAADIANETAEVVQWVAEPYVASGSITELDGKIKAAGKTTWLLAMCRKVVDGQDFMGYPTSKTPVVYLTEQGRSSFREALRRADLLSRTDFTVLRYHDVIGTPWPQVIEAAARQCLSQNARLLVIDTLPQFAGLRGEAENHSGAALEALDPVHLVASRGIGVVLSRHERKAGGDVGDSGRGSSAWGGVADIIIAIRRGDGNTPPNIRVLQSLSRFDETPDTLVIELQGGEYVSLGNETQVALRLAKDAILSTAPRTEDDAKATNDLIKDAEVKSTIAKEALNELLREGQLSRTGGGKKGNPYKYWAPGMIESEPDEAITETMEELVAGQDPEQLELIQSYIGDVVATESISGVPSTDREETQGQAKDLGLPSEMDSGGTPTVYSDRINPDDILVVD